MAKTVIEFNLSEWIGAGGGLFPGSLQRESRTGTEKFHSDRSMADRPLQSVAGLAADALLDPAGSVDRRAITTRQAWSPEG